jgi:hypothetical protein
MPAATGLFQHLKPGAEIILRTREADSLAPRVADLTGKLVSVKVAVVEVDSLSRVLEEQSAFLGPGPCPIMLDAREPGAFAPLIRAAAALASHGTKVMLPLRDRRDLQAIKLLTSLQVHVVIDLTRSDVDWVLAEEAMVDSLLALVPRAPLDPFMMLSTIHADLGSRFTLGSIYFDDGKDYVYVDERGRLYATRRDLQTSTVLDIELSEIEEGRECLGCAEARQHREHMTRLSACAFCPGYRLCRGYLGPAPANGACQHLFENLLETSRARSVALTGARTTQ